MIGGVYRLDTYTLNERLISFRFARADCNKSMYASLRYKRIIGVCYFTKSAAGTVVLSRIEHVATNARSDVVNLGAWVPTDHQPIRLRHRADACSVRANACTAKGDRMEPAYRIAIAVSDPVDRIRLREFLLRSGHEIVLEASNSEDLIRRCNTASTQLIVTDIGECSIDCLEAAHSLLLQHNVPAIVVAGADDDNCVNRVNACGALAYLTKPVQQNELAAAISIAMRRFEELQLLRHEVVDARRALEERKFVERAKGIIMKKRQMDEPAAFSCLQELARNHRKTLVEVAKSIVLAEQALNSPA